MHTLSLRKYKVLGQICRSHFLYTKSYPDYTDGKLEYGSINSAQIVGYIDLICIISLIYFNAAVLSDPNSLVLTLTSSLVYKLDYIQNLTFYILYYNLSPKSQIRERILYKCLHKRT